MNDKKFYERSIKITKDHDLSVTLLILLGLGVVYLFGSSVITNVFTATALKIIVSVLTLTFAWELAKNGLFKMVYQVVAFIIAINLVGMGLSKLPVFIMTQDVTGFSLLLDQLDQEYTGHVEIGESGFAFNKEGNTPQTITVAPAVEIPQVDQNVGGGVPTQTTTTVEQVVAPTVVAMTEEARILESNHLEIQVALIANDLTTALEIAEATYTAYADAYSLEVIQAIQTARVEKENRLSHLSVANSSSTSFMAGGEETVNLDLLRGNTWLVVAEGESYGWYACQKNVIIEQKDGLLKGSQYTIKYCLLANVNGEGEVNSSFEVK